MPRDLLALFGISVPALPDAVPPTYDATEIAKKLGIYIKAFTFADKQKNAALVAVLQERHGKDGHLKSFTS